LASTDAPPTSDESPSKTRMQVQHRLGPDEVQEPHKRREAGLTIRQLAEEFGIHRTTVVHHLKRRTS
jgi:hypothetical protein